MMAAQTLLLLLLYSFLFIISLQKSAANSSSSSYCNPSSCGAITNISYPFRLKRDPKHCGDADYELACDNNVTFLNLNSQKFYVKEIIYNTSAIRLVDASININDTCSFPTYSMYRDNFSFFLDSAYIPPITTMFPYIYPLRNIRVMSCPRPLQNSSGFTNITSCHNQISNSRSFVYAKIRRMPPSEIKQSCSLDKVVMTTWEFAHPRNVSLEELHRALVYGFHLNFCPQCRRESWTKLYRVKRFIFGSTVLYLIPVAILVFVSAGISLPVMVAVGFTCVLVLLFIPLYGVYALGRSNWQNGSEISLDGKISSIVSIIIIGGLKIIVSPIVVWILIYTFRRRRLSMYEAIETFLQSDNKLAPIRYSYSDLKKITRGFREKLGEGGFGSVYKGKLRSGQDVAVKLLRKPKENSRDFMNEIATIGRIHHVNVVKLVGYCAEGAKRALIFDFMPNGSLDKYILSREETNHLDWDTKFTIAIEVARGIKYLHHGCDIKILHFDIKPHNVLLDDKFVAKISDFGLAKLSSIEKDGVTLTAVRGTIGYVAPELMNRNIGRVTYKADVYSFGMLLMEMVGLNRDLKRKNNDPSKYFPDWIYDHLNEGGDIEIGRVEEDMNGNDENDGVKRLVRKMTIVALWCIRVSPDDRPSMNKVLEMLEGEVERLQIPDYPQSQAPQIVANEDETWSNDDSVSFLYSNDTTKLEIRIEDFQTLQQQ